MKWKQYSEENKCIMDYYINDKNYKVVVDDNCDNNLCYTFFSSNGLYHNDEFSFNMAMKNNKYEYINIAKSIKAKKKIFIRDVWLSWYVKGINYEIDSISKLLEWLKENTEGYSNIIVGTSSGGYIGAIASWYIDAEVCFCNCGQFSLVNHYDHVRKNELLNKYINDESRNCFYESYILLRKKKQYHLFVC